MPTRSRRVRSRRSTWPYKGQSTKMTADQAAKDLWKVQKTISPMMHTLDTSARSIKRTAQQVKGMVPIDAALSNAEDYVWSASEDLFRAVQDLAEAIRTLKQGI